MEINEYQSIQYFCKVNFFRYFSIKPKFQIYLSYYDIIQRVSNTIVFILHKIIFQIRYISFICTRFLNKKSSNILYNFVGQVEEIVDQKR